MIFLKRWCFFWQQLWLTNVYKRKDRPRLRCLQPPIIISETGNWGVALEAANLNRTEVVTHPFVGWSFAPKTHDSWNKKKSWGKCWTVHLKKINNKLSPELSHGKNVRYIGPKDVCFKKKSWRAKNFLSFQAWPHRDSKSWSLGHGEDDDHDLWSMMTCVASCFFWYLEIRDIQIYTWKLEIV